MKNGEISWICMTDYSKCNTLRSLHSIEFTPCQRSPAKKQLLMTLKNFRIVFKSLAKRQGKDGVYLRANQNVNYGIVAQVLAIIQSAGVTNLGFVTEPEEVVK